MYTKATSIFRYNLKVNSNQVNLGICTYYYMKMYHVGVFFLVNCATRDNIGEWPTSFAKSAKGLFDALQLVLVLSEPQQNFDSL